MTVFANLKFSQATYEKILLCLVVLLGPLASSTGAQSRSATDGTTPLALTSGAPAGSYALGGFENVNPYNGNLNFSLPMVGMSGRGETSYSMMLKIERHWRVEHEIVTSEGVGCDPAGPCPSSSYDFFHPIPDSWGAIPAVDGPQGPGTLQIRYEGLPAPTCAGLYRHTLTRLTFTAPDGTEYDLRDQLNGGKPITAALINACNTQDVSRGTVFITADGTSASFVSDYEIIDDQSDGVAVDSASGYLMLRDGTRYRIDNGTVTWLRDRNGNQTRYSYDVYRRVTVITDSLNRQVTISYATTSSGYDQINFKGFGGAARTMRVWHANLNGALRQDFALLSLSQLFPQLNGASGFFNPTVISALELPDGSERRYQFSYNSYGELARVVLPTGGAIEYDYAAGVAGDNLSGVILRTGGNTNTNNQYQIYRRVIERRLYSDGVTLESKTTISRPEQIGSNSGFVEVNQFNSSGSLLASEKHYYYGSPSESLYLGPLSYPAWNDGKEYQTERFNTDGTNPTTMLQRVEHNWQPGTPITSNPTASINGRIVETVTTVTTLGETNQVSKQSSINPTDGTIGFDQYNNKTDVWEYDFGAAAPGPLRRHTQTAYVTATNYIDAVNGAHLRNLPERTSVYDSGGVERARTTFEYDNYTTDTNHAALKDWSAITGIPMSGHEVSFTSGFPTRGNATATIGYLITNGAVPDCAVSPSQCVKSFAQYDIAGNVVKAIDARGYATTLDYTDCFGGPDGNAHLNSLPLELSSPVVQASYAFATSATNALGHTSYTQFDYYLGRPVDTEDANGVKSSGYYGGPLDRLTKGIAAVGTATQAQINFLYDDTNQVITTARDQINYGESSNGLGLISKSYYDRLGRTWRTASYEGNNSWIVAEKEYDALGRDKRLSNPYRYSGADPADATPPNEWTANAYDALSRVISVTTPDSAVVSTTYSGNTVTVTDQAGKQRKSVSDGLGRLIRVYEAPNDPSYNYLTSYEYDVQDNLTKVTQGTQTPRTFAYDSLKRLKSAMNPESGTIDYEYDNNGNLTHKTDARSVDIDYAYDALNRNTTVNYSNTTLDPDITRAYDNPTAGANGRGRFWYSYAGGNDSTGSNVEQTAIDSYDALGRPLAQRQLFKLNGTWAPAYQTQRSYNLAGGVILQTYPSTRTVHYAYDNAGRTSAFTGNLGDGVGLPDRTYATGIIYSPAGGMSKEQFGTDTPVYNKLFYNSRGQLSEIRASTSYTGPTDKTSNRGELINWYSGQCGGADCNNSDNNGNLKKQDVSIPDSDLNLYPTLWNQQYDYDSLNRLQLVHEYAGYPQTELWKQEYVYDRWGNRTIHQTNTWGPASGPLIPKPNHEIETGTNRLYAPGDLPKVDSQRLMRYDAAGNLTKDAYSGAGDREYDAENRMTKAWGGINQWQEYTYNADGQRVRRKVNGAETWQVYGMDGELLAEYPANVAAASPQKEYGYRNGQLLITAEAPAASAINVALQSNGASATASSAYSGWAASGANNGDRKGLNGGQDGGWVTAQTGFPAWLQVQFNGNKTISEIDVFTIQDNWLNPSEPTEAMTFSVYGLTGYEVQYWNGSAWVTVTGGSITGNNKVWRKFTFAAITTSKIRVLTNASTDGYSRLAEVEAWTGTPPPPVINVALQSSDAIATGSSAYAGWAASGANNGDRKGLNGGQDGGWVTAQTGFPAWLQVDFSGNKTISEIDVFTIQDNFANPSEPTEAMTFSLYGLTEFEVQYWNGSDWVTVTGGSVTGNNKVWRKFTFTAITTNKIRVLTHASTDGYSRLAEVEAWSPAASGDTSSNIQWLVTDQLGTPRMVIDKTGALANVKRHDYLPFGEELFAGQGSRTPQQGYVADSVRQQFTRKERDNETGLDYFGARYFASTQGRFTSIDPLMGTGDVSQPQSWNRYSYTHNNPVNLIDVLGLYVWGTGATDDRKEMFRTWLADVRKARDSYDKKSNEYTRLNGVIKSYGEENQAGVSIRFDTTDINGKDLGNKSADTHTDFFRSGGKVIAEQDVTFNTNNLKNVGVSTVAHEGQHLVDDKAFAASLVVRGGRVYETDANKSLPPYQAENRGFETGQFASQALHRNDIRWAGSNPPYALYLNSWAEQDKKALEATMGRARADYIQRWYGYNEKNQGEKIKIP